MNKTKVIIVDDEMGGRESLNHMLQKNHADLEVCQLCESAEEAYTAIESHTPDLVFLDIEMPAANGFDLLNKFEHLPFKVIFTTAYDHYAIKAIQFSAIDYLLKPIDEQDLAKAIDRYQKKKKDTSLDKQFTNLLTHLGNQGNKKIAIPDVDGLEFVSINNIIRCHSDGSYTVFHLENGTKIMASKPIGEFEELLSEDHFYRVHRSSLINMDHIKKYVKGEGGYVILSDGAEVEVSRRKKSDFLESLSAFRLG